MSIKIKLSELHAAAPHFKRVMSERMPVKTAYRLKRLVDRVDSELKSFEKQQNEFIKELGAPDPKNPVMISIQDPEKMVEFGKRMDELGSLEITIDRDHIKLEDLGNINVSPIEMSALSKFIEE